MYVRAAIVRRRVILVSHALSRSTRRLRSMIAISSFSTSILFFARKQILRLLVGHDRLNDLLAGFWNDRLKKQVDRGQFADKLFYERLAFFRIGFNHLK